MLCNYYKDITFIVIICWTAGMPATVRSAVFCHPDLFPKIIAYGDTTQYLKAFLVSLCR